MAEMQLPAMIETGGGFGGMGAGLGGLIGGLVLGSIWGGGFGGFGGYGGRGMAPGQVGADVAIQNGIQNVQNAVQAGAVAQAQGVGQLGMQIANTGAGVVQGINANTIAGLQGQNAVQQQMCCATGRLSQEIDQAGDQTVAAVNAANMNISAQGYENRIQAQAIANQLQNQHADLKATIIEQGCQDRETMRQIADQQVRDKLNECQNELAAQRAQNNLTAQLQQQTLYLISQLKTTTTPAAGA